MHKLVLLRHGESVWNKENKFTGWVDVELSPKGIEEAKNAASLLKKKEFTFDMAFTSVLKRATETLRIVLQEMRLSIPIKYSWRLNERHYGALQGLNKAETVAKYGEEQVLKWRRGYAMPPLPLKKSDPYYPGNDPKYKGIPADELPLTECLKDTVKRFMPYWEKEIVPEIKAGKKVIISAHGNSLRALVKHLDNISDEDITKLNIPTGIPLIYELDDNLKPIRHYYLGDPAEVKKATEKVANETR